ncbi:MAG TPA: DUF2127 domain-containing protein [Thermoanaerobaculia bacterium]|nr:DUF2127 domain-containing protein [Thermoanaerobaculia bacterium]
MKLTHKTLHRLFEIGVILKGIDGVLELVGGALLLAVSHPTLNRLVFAITRQEISEDPHDLVANALRSTVAHLSVGTQTFSSVYLLVHGAIKIVLVAGLLRRKLWAYPSALSVLALFVLYQGYRLSHTRSLALLVLTAVDLVILYLIAREYRWLRRSIPSQPTDRQDHSSTL